ncbi:RNA polymerase I enhancer binding protein [Serendipita sp. 399]|nr:RNA polymerase I enhancer binding protein [Serendipita sp. 399]
MATRYGKPLSVLPVSEYSSESSESEESISAPAAQQIQVDNSRKRRRDEEQADGERQKRRHVHPKPSRRASDLSHDESFAHPSRDNSPRDRVLTSAYGSSLNNGTSHRTGPDMGQGLVSDEFMQFIRNMDVDGLTEEDDQTTGKESPAISKPREKTKNPLPVTQIEEEDLSFLLATKWLAPKELKKLEEEKGFQYKRGAFSDAERASVEAALNNFGLTHDLSRDDILELIFTKKSTFKAQHKTFWSDIAMAVPMRPVVAVFNFCRRAYHPLQKQGKWTPQEDALLVSAVRQYGQFWERVSERVGRMGSDCRDRYRIYLQDASDRNHGPWSKEEEEQLISIMKEFNTDKTPDEADTAFWGAVVKRMGGTRNRGQIRSKWREHLVKTVKTDGPRRWLPIDAYILVHKLATIDITDDKEISWRLLLDDGWNVWSPHDLQRRWMSMKKGVVGYEQMSYREILDILLAKKGSLPPEDIAAAIRQTQYGKPKTPRRKPGHAIRSQQIIEDSDDGLST